MAYEGTTEVWIVGAVRSPIGKRGGALSPVRPDDLGALVLENLMERTGVLPKTSRTSTWSAVTRRARMGHL